MWQVRPHRVPEVSARVWGWLRVSRGPWPQLPERWPATAAHEPWPLGRSGSRPEDPSFPSLPSFPFVVWQTQTFQRKLLPVPERETVQCHLPNSCGTFSGSPSGTEVLVSRTAYLSLQKNPVPARGNPRGCVRQQADLSEEWTSAPCLLFAASVGALFLILIRGLLPEQ